MTLACFRIVCLKCVLFLQGLESADERCRPERCWPEGMMGRRNKARAVRCSHLFRSQHKGSMVINVDMCFVFDSLGSSFHTHTMENDVFMYFLCLASIDFCAVHLTYSTMSLTAFSLFIVLYENTPCKHTSNILSNIKLKEHIIAIFVMLLKGENSLIFMFTFFISFIYYDYFH